MQGIGPKTGVWTEVYEASNVFENEELLLRNTYLNAQIGPFVDWVVIDSKCSGKIKWADDCGNGISLASVITDKESSLTCKQYVGSIMKKHCTSDNNESKKPRKEDVVKDNALLGDSIRNKTNEILIKQNQREMEMLLSRIPNLINTKKLLEHFPLKLMEYKSQIHKAVHDIEYIKKLPVARRGTQSARPSSAIVRCNTTPSKRAKK